jgi:hypothetical protein
MELAAVLIAKAIVQDSIYPAMHPARFMDEILMVLCRAVSDQEGRLLRGKGGHGTEMSSRPPCAKMVT